MATLIGVGAVAMSLTRPAGRRNHHRNYDGGSDGGGHDEPGSRLEGAHPTDGGQDCWSRRWSAWCVDQSEAKSHREYSGLKNG